MNWIIPENKLDAQQREFIVNVDITRKNVWIKGFPGSGKSVLLAYTIKRIKSKDSGASVLLVVFTHSLISMYEAAFAEMGLDFPVNVMTFYDFMKSNESYDYILADEVQDLTPSVLQKMKDRARHVVVAGDSNQSIYDKDPKFEEETVSPSRINELLSSSEFELGIIHRLSSSIINALQKFLPSLNIFSAKRDLTKETTQIRLCEARHEEDEVKYIMTEALKAVKVGQTVGILIPTHKDIRKFIKSAIESEGKRPRNDDEQSMDYAEINRYLSSNNIPMQYVGNGYGQFNGNANKVCVMTYHSSKGLDFDNVFLPYLNNSLFIAPNRGNSELGQTLFMVAMTRSRKNLYLTYSGVKHKYLRNFEADCHKIDIHDALNVQQKFDGDSIFAGF